MSDLKPCPFCGKYPQTVVDDETEEKFGVKCFSCGGSIYPEKVTLQEAIKAWNKRADEPQMWTPVSEKPKTSGLYNCTCYDGVTHRVTTLKWSNGWMLSGRRAYWKVLAWMPLPKPYRCGIICGGLRR